MPGRNDPCPCGSGKKFKHCCIDKAQAAQPPRTSQIMLCTVCRDAKAVNALACKVCGKRYGFCSAHAAAASGNMNGHVMRVHPEVIPDLRKKLQEQPEVLADIMEKAKGDPENWAAFVAWWEGKGQVRSRVAPPAPTPDPPAPGGLRFVDIPPEHNAERCAAALRAAALPGVIVTSQSGGWSLCLSDEPDPLSGWMLTMKLLTPNHSIDADWKQMGKITAALGVPREVVLQTMTAMEHDPGGTHRFQWTDPTTKGAPS
jgi:hypothetical protein